MAKINMAMALPPVSKSIPFRSKILPPMSSGIPLLATKLPEIRYIPMVSGVIPLVSTHIPITIQRHLGLLPSRQWGKTGIPVKRRWEVRRPTEIGFFEALCKLVVKLSTLPVQPMVAIARIGEEIEAHTGEERDIESQIRGEILELKMKYEMGEIAEEEFKRRERELKKKLEDLEK